MSAVVRELQIAPEKRTTSTRAVLWFGVIGGIVAWVADLVISWGLVQYSFTHDKAFWLHATTIITAIVTLAAGAAAWSVWKQVRTKDGGDPQGGVIETEPDIWIDDHRDNVMGTDQGGLIGNDLDRTIEIEPDLSKESYRDAVIEPGEGRKNETGRGRAIETDRFMSFLGLVTSGYFLLLILLQGVGTLVLGPGKLW
ncbi:MAG: hypothetical protein ACR2OU_20110 [Thermomicrobiales bacterium]